MESMEMMEKIFWKTENPMEVKTKRTNKVLQIIKATLLRF